MPIYVYQVITPEGDGEIFEVQQSITDPSLTVHPESGLPVQRVYTAPNLALKHSGPAQRSKLAAGSLARHGFSRDEEAGKGQAGRVWQPAGGRGRRGRGGREDRAGGGGGRRFGRRAEARRV